MSGHHTKHCFLLYYQKESAMIDFKRLDLMDGSEISKHGLGQLRLGRLCHSEHWVKTDWLIDRVCRLINSKLCSMSLSMSFGVVSDIGMRDKQLIFVSTYGYESQHPELSALSSYLTLFIFYIYSFIILAYKWFSHEFYVSKRTCTCEFFGVVCFDFGTW